MAIRNILTDQDPILHKVCKPVETFDERLWQLLDDMADTLHKADGVGLAAPQVGVVRRLFIMDTGDGLKECINPTILEERYTGMCRRLSVQPRGIRYHSPPEKGEAASPEPSR